MTFSLATEFVENETYTDEFGNVFRTFDKQDCELKASYRLLKKIIYSLLSARTGFLLLAIFAGIYPPIIVNIMLIIIKIIE